MPFPGRVTGRGGPGAALLAAVVATLAASAEAGGVVGNGSPASCTEAALDAALDGGGTVTFHCGGPVVIPVTAVKTLTTTTTVDGTGQQITLDGGGTTRLFETTYQFASFTITLRNLTLRNARGGRLRGGRPPRVPGPPHDPERGGGALRRQRGGGFR